MNKFLAFFLIVSIFQFNVFCYVNPSTLGLPFPPPPKGVEFVDCFVVYGITSETLKTDNNSWYQYNHICLKEFQFPEDELTWFFIGSYKGPAELAQDMPPFHCIPMEQPLMKFVFLRGQVVELMFKDMDFEITFQSLEQSQTFYKAIHNDAKLTFAARNKIGMLHEMTLQTYQPMGKHIEALLERINDTRYITFKSEQGEPLLIFPETQSELLRAKDSGSDRLQLLLRVRTAYYILTFSSHDEAKKFSQALARYLKTLHLGRIVNNMKNRFENNGITVDPRVV